MLELRPVCENCGVSLPPAAQDARICSFECTFCAKCVDDALMNVCPNCGGGFVRRPVRPTREWRPGESLTQHPASTKQKHRPVDEAAHAGFAATICGLPDYER